MVDGERDVCMSGPFTCVAAAIVTLQQCFSHLSKYLMSFLGL